MRKDRSNIMANQKYVIGVDGGGTKTIIALADLNKKIVAVEKGGPSSPRNLGVKKAVFNIAEAIYLILKKTRKDDKIVSTFIALPALEEEYKFRKEEIKKEILKQNKISKIFEGDIIIGSDQIAAFRSGADGKDGVILIAGTGCVAHGWRKEKEAKASGWGWLADEGSAFWVGQKALQAIFKDLDGRGKRTSLAKVCFEKFGIKEKEDLLKKIYGEKPTKIVPLFSILCDEAAKKNDIVAKRILIEAGGEAAKAAIAAVKNLDFKNKKFPLVLVGGMFKSDIFLNAVKKEIRKTAPNAKFILPKNEPVFGAVKLAVENL